MRPWLPGLLLALLLLLGMSVAWADCANAEPRLSGLPVTIQTGEWIDIAWSDLPAGTHEVELEVSMEGGRWRRISPELEAREGHFMWQVPASLNGAARVRLRFGGQHGEAVASASEPFMIEGVAPHGPDRLGDDESWSRRGGIGETLPAECVNGVPHLSATLARFEAELPRRYGLVLQAPRNARPLVELRMQSRLEPMPPVRSASPFTPLRN